jgi:hypothetical protein
MSTTLTAPKPPVQNSPQRLWATAMSSSISRMSDHPVTFRVAGGPVQPVTGTATTTTTGDPVTVGVKQARAELVGA